MRMRAELSFPNLPEVFRTQVAKGFTAAVRRETRALEKEFEAATLAAGLGQNMARTWQSRTFPANRDAIGAAGYVWSKARQRMRAFAEGAVVVPKQGRFLAIPTVWNRQGGRKGAAPRVTPAQMVAAKGQAFVFTPKGSPGVKIWAVRAAAVGGRGRSKYAVSAGGLLAVNASGSRAALRQGNQRALLQQGFVPMFVLIPRAVIRKRLDLPPMVHAAEGRLRVALAETIHAAERSLGGRR